MSTGIPMTCQHCGRPIAGLATHIGHLAYHPECTHGPGYPMQYAPMPPAPGAHPFAPVSEERVRQIVREEIDAKLRNVDLTPNIRFGGSPAVG